MLRETRQQPREEGEEGRTDGRTDGAEELLAARGNAVKCYLESHLAHKDGGENVVGDGEEDSFLGDAVGERRRRSEGRIHPFIH